jgi:RimJ/RimL family protein N-acetyltransferase
LVRGGGVPTGVLARARSPGRAHPGPPAAGHQREEAARAVGLLRLWEMKHFVGQNGLHAPEPVELTDGTATLRPLRPADAAAHLAGEDDELVEWLNGGVGTAATVRAHIDRAAAMWAAGGPTFNFGIRNTATDILVGTIDIQLDQPYAADNQANLAFGLYPRWRGQGLAIRAVLLAVRFLVQHTDIEEALIRVDPFNTASAAVAERADFRHIGKGNESENYEWFIRVIR